jgi:hypothetical protein
MKCPQCCQELKKEVRKPISPEKLKNVAKKNLWYVICMLNKTATLTAEPNSPENNAYIESFVIHARILIEFLYGRPIKKDTIYAADYVDHWWDNYIGKGKPLEKTDLLRDVEINANKLAAHLTLVGSENEVYKWNRVKIRDEINKEISEFLKKVPETTISKDIKEKIVKVMTPPRTIRVIP